MLKVFIMGQYMLMKFRISADFRSGCSEVHKFIDSKTKVIGFVNKLYNKGVDFAYKIATSDPNQQQAQPQQWLNSWSVCIKKVLLFYFILL